MARSLAGDLNYAFSVTSEFEFPLSGYAAGLSVRVKVRALGNEYNCAPSPFAYEIVTKVGAAPEIPALPTPTLTGSSAIADSITITWTPITNATKYYVSYARDDSPFATESVEKTATSFTLSGLFPGEEFRFKVRAVGDGVDYVSSDYSTLTSIKTLDKQDPIVLSAPNNPRETSKTEASFTVAWDAVENASGYGLIYKKSTDASYKTVNLSPETTSYKLSGLDGSAKYYWKVRAFGDGEDYASSSYVATRIVALRQKLATPVATYEPSTTSITVSWNAVENASSYRIMYKPAGGSYITTNVGADATSYTILELTPGTKCAVKIAALGDGFDYSNSDFSTLTSVQTVDSPLGVLSFALRNVDEFFDEEGWFAGLEEDYDLLAENLLVA